MFRSFIDHTKMTVSATVAKYVGRALVAALFLVAAGFAVGAIGVRLSETYGPMTACALLAGAFTLLAVIAWLFTLANERRQQALLKRVESDRTAFTTALSAAAPVALAQGASFLTRRTPLVVLAVVLGALYVSSLGARRRP